MTGTPGWSRKRLGVAAIVAGAAGLIAAAPAAAQDKVITVPAELITDAKYDPIDGTTLHQCQAAALVRWVAVPNAIPVQPRRVFFTDTQSMQPGGVREFAVVPPTSADTFGSNLRNRDFSAPPGTHQIVVAQNSGSDVGTSFCEPTVNEYNARFGALRVEVKVPADAPAPPEGGEGTPGAPPTGAAGSKTRVKVSLGAKWGKRTIRANKLRRVTRNARIVVTGRTTPRLARTRILVQRRIVTRARTRGGVRRTVVRWRTIRRVTTMTNGRYRFVYRARKLGRDTIRISVDANTTRARSVSPQLRLAVIAPRRA